MMMMMMMAAMFVYLRLSFVVALTGSSREKGNVENKAHSARARSIERRTSAVQTQVCAVFYNGGC